MPEFLERRYNSTCRYLFPSARSCCGSWLKWPWSCWPRQGDARHVWLERNRDHYRTGRAGRQLHHLRRVGVRAWTDFLQFVVMMLGGLIVTVVGLHKVGGLHELMMDAPEKFKFIYPATDRTFPGSGCGLWRSRSASGTTARTSSLCSVVWVHAASGRADGVVFAGFMKIVLPLLVVIPGIVAFRLYPGLEDPDQAFRRSCANWCRSD